MRTRRAGTAWARAGRAAGAQGVHGRVDRRYKQLGERVWGARERERAAANAAAGETSGSTGVQGRAGCTATWQPCAATRPGGSATTRPRARRLCAQAGPAGPGWGFVHSDSVFGTGLTRYFS